MRIPTDGLLEHYSPEEERHYFEEFSTMVSEAAESIRTLTDEEALADFQATGGDPEVGPEEAREALLEALWEWVWE